MNYFVQHWRGRLNLRQSFWINFAIPIAILSVIGSLLSKIILVGSAHSATVLTSAFVVLFLLIYTWQVVGVLRASDRFALESGDRAWSTAAQAGVVLSIIFAVVIVFDAYQNLLGFKQSLQASAQPQIEKQYSLELSEDKTKIHLKGVLQAGVTRELKQLVEKQPQIKMIALESEGGRIYEGRGLAKLIREKSLATHVETECMSACTTAYIGGRERSLAANARLGFHQYKTYSVQSNINVDEEQQRDIAIFLQQGVDKIFLNKVFSTPFEATWFPTSEELIRAGVVHRIEK